MQNLSDVMADKNDNKEYSSFCSCCNSMLRSICSAGVPSFFEANDENNVEKQFTKDNINVLVSSKHNEENAFNKNVYNSIENSLIISKPRMCNEEHIIQNDYTGNKKRKYIESLNEIDTSTSKIISAKRVTFINNKSDNINLEKIRRINQGSETKTATLSDVKNKTLLSRKRNRDDTLNYETFKTTVLLTTTKENNLNKSIARVNDALNSFPETNLSLMKSQNKTLNTEQSILNRRERITKRLNTISHLCNRINIMREIVLEEVRKKQSG